MECWLGIWWWLSCWIKDWWEGWQGCFGCGGRGWGEGQFRSRLLGSCVDGMRMNRWFSVVMVRLGRMMMRVVDRLCSGGMCREDAERVLAGQGEGEGGLLCRRELIKVLRLATPHLGQNS